jgi:hypothetical protein
MVFGFSVAARDSPASKSLLRKAASERLAASTGQITKQSQTPRNDDGTAVE